MGYDFDKTHELILESAKAQFAEAGFRDASIRRICSDAGVTNGAFYSHFKSKEDLFGSLVAPALEGLFEIYGREKDNYREIKSRNDILKVFGNTSASHKVLIKYIYENKDIFLLLLRSSGGTSYEGFPKMLVEREEKETEAFFSFCKAHVRKPENMTTPLIHKMSELVVSTMFDCLIEGESEEETERQTRLVSDFCLAGIKEIWGI